jgi:hypothetical protein
MKTKRKNKKLPLLLFHFYRKSLICATKKIVSFRFLLLYLKNLKNFVKKYEELGIQTLILSKTTKTRI